MPENEDLLESYTPPMFVALSGRIEHTDGSDVCRSVILTNLNQVTRIEVTPPKPIKMDFPEVKTTKKRSENTVFKCDIYHSDGYVRRLDGEEAEAFCNWVLGLGVPRFDNHRSLDKPE